MAARPELCPPAKINLGAVWTALLKSQAPASGCEADWGLCTLCEADLGASSHVAYSGRMLGGSYTALKKVALLYGLVCSRRIAEGSTPAAKVSCGRPMCLCLLPLSGL